MNRLPIVVIEDDGMIREGLQELLELEGYEVYTAENGRRGLEQIRALNGHCFVLLDLQMPVMSGEELLESLHADPNEEIRKVPVVVLTARAASFTHERIVGFIKKPVDIDELLTVIETCGASDGG